MPTALPYETVVEIAVVTLPGGHEVCVSVGSGIIYRSRQYEDRDFALMTAKNLGEHVADYARNV